VKRRRRLINEQGLSFLDAISCGFGAVILLFIIVDHAIVQVKQPGNDAMATRVDAAEDQVLDEKQTLLLQQAALDDVLEATRLAEAEAERLRRQIQTQRQQQPTREDAQEASRTRLQQQQAELLALEAEVEALRAQANDPAGDAIRDVRGDGRQQYLSGLTVEAQRILILVDASASMLGYTIVDAIRRRNQSAATRLAAAKWRRTLAAADWMSAQIPATSQFQILAFNTAVSAPHGSASGWLQARGGTDINRAISGLRKVVPEGGTSLHAAFGAARALQPAPDAIYLITDGLPTQGARVQRGTVSGGERLSHFNQALSQLPRGVTVHTLLLPMEGDPRAGGAFWNLARASGGTVLMPSKDWP
jgi:hypothetical protein